MGLDPTQEKWLERFFPGLVQAVANLGSGEFRPERPVIGGPGLDCVENAGLHLEYRLADKTTVKIKISSRMKQGAPAYRPKSKLEPVNLDHWERYHYSLHYGRSLDEETFFRFDLEEGGQAHVHMRPDTGLHIPCEFVEPNVAYLDPRTFIEMVAAYRSDKSNYPVRKKS